ncbi:MAG: hydrogenase formation protein HypD [Endomicrobia bacterium]|nr:hydrogenase formation protein HypD [Endomicrobiia bacterium]MCL2798921.1 hydrogenase formation protein HypD [Endomicrobiia bacterium]
MKKNKIMEVCGTHTAAISKFGLRNFFDGVDMVSGPGCPVCVTPSNRIEQCVVLSRNRNIIIATFGDMLRVPSITSSFEKEKSSGADIRIIYSVYDCLKIASENQKKEVVFAGAGFETTAPAAAVLIKEAYKRKVKNFSVFSMFKSVFPALENIAKSKDLKIDGFLLPGNVASITGSDDFKFLKKPCVVSGFLENEIISAVNILERLIKDKKNKIANAYGYAVSPGGNKKAKKFISEVFDLGDDYWRGLGVIKKSGFKINSKYENFDADKKFCIKPVSFRKDACLCGKIMKGIITPDKCPGFAKKCVPENPLGPCMVSSEGICAAYYKYGESEK